MNKLMIIGALGSDPELRSTSTGIPVTTFSVAVNGKKKEDPTQWFRVTAWRGLAEICSKYLAKGRKVAVVGPVTLNTYETKSGKQGASLEVTAEDVEFLTPRPEAEPVDQFIPVDPGDELPF